jgi:hypothetical protein
MPLNDKIEAIIADLPFVLQFWAKSVKGFAECQSEGEINNLMLLLIGRHYTTAKKKMAAFFDWSQHDKQLAELNVAGQYLNVKSAAARKAADNLMLALINILIQIAIDKIAN